MEPKTITKEWAKEPIKLGPPRRVYAASTPFDYVKWADSMQEAVKKCHASSKQPLVSIASYTTIAAADEPTGCYFNRHVPCLDEADMDLSWGLTVVYLNDLPDLPPSNEEAD